MKIKLIIAAAIIGAAGCFTGLAMAAGGHEVTSPDDQAIVLREFDRLYIETPLAPDLVAMNVRVFGPDNELLLSTRSKGDSVEFLVNSGLPDGEYRYETVSIFGNVDLSSRENFVDGDTTIMRDFGSFTVSNGQISERTVPNQLDLAKPDEASLIDRMLKGAVNLAGVTLDFLIPSAHAVDLTAESTTPHILFDDTDDELCSPAWDWSVRADGGINDTDTNNTFVINGVAEPTVNCGSDVPIIRLNHNGLNTTASSIDSLVVDPDGDIHWAQSRMNFDKGSSALSIGTSAVRRDLTISSSDPAIDLFDETYSDSMGINYNGFDFSIYNTSGVDSVAMSFAAPANSLHIQSNGRTGFGTSDPQENIHAVGNIRTDGYFRGQSTFPGFWLDELGSGYKGANVVLDGGVLQIQRRAQGFGGYEAAPMRVFLAAPMNSFVVNAAGYLGLGLNPTSPIHSVTGARLSAGGVWQNASSREYKENIHDVDAAEAMAAFKALKPVSYNYKVDSEDAYIGFIAEDVPEIVASKDRKTLSSMDMVALVTRVVQDQQDTIEEKSAKIDAMEQQLADQTQKFALQQERMDKLETMLRMVAGFEDADNEVVVNLK